MVFVLKFFRLGFHFWGFKRLFLCGLDFNSRVFMRFFFDFRELILNFGPFRGWTVQLGGFVVL